MNNQITAQRHVRFYAFSLVSAENMEFGTRTQQFDWLAEQGFYLVLRALYGYSSEFAGYGRKVFAEDRD